MFKPLLCGEVLAHYSLGIRDLGVLNEKISAALSCCPWIHLLLVDLGILMVASGFFYRMLLEEAEACGHACPFHSCRAESTVTVL